jgi:hypothetical protein
MVAKASGDGKKPTIVPAQHAIWVPVTKSWEELGFNFKEFPSSTMASEIGQIPEDGGDLLPFLNEYRRIIEGDATRPQILFALSELAKPQPAISEKMGGDIAQAFVVWELMELNGCGSVTAKRLYEAGFICKSDVMAAQIDNLMAIKGIGKKTAQTLLGS